MAFSQHEEIKNPEPKTLSDRQVAIIKKSWEIPFAKVRFDVTKCHKTTNRHKEWTDMSFVTKL